MLSMSAPAAVSSILQAIGNTPVVKLKRIPSRGGADVFVKLEYYNPTGSYKDRMATAMIEGAERRGALKPGMRVTEYTGGSTGTSLAMVCALKGYTFIPVSTDAIAREKLQSMRLFGADLQIIKSPDGRLTPELFRAMIARAEELSHEPGVFWTDQFNNTDALEGYKGIGRELLEQLGEIAAFCGAVGTAGMLVGVSRALKAAGSRARIIALEPVSSPVLTAGQKGSHRVDGVAPGFVPPHLKHEDYDEARAVEESEAREMARRLAKEEGIFAGTSSGLNVAAAVKLAEEFRPGQAVVTLAVDTGLKYLAGDLFET
jgi:cysteine synthase